MFKANGLFIGALASICAVAGLQSARRDKLLEERLQALEERDQLLETKYNERDHQDYEQLLGKMVERKCNEQEHALKLKMVEAEAFTQQTFDRLQSSVEKFTELFELMYKRVQENQITGKRRYTRPSNQRDDMGSEIQPVDEQSAKRISLGSS
jgi:hypothetical protein